TATHEGKVIGFCCGDCLADFKEDPAPVLKKLGLAATAETPAVAAGAPINEKCPLSGKPVDPAKTATHEGKVIGFCCGDCLADFKADPAPVLKKLGLAATAEAPAVAAATPI